MFSVYTVNTGCVTVILCQNGVILIYAEFVCEGNAYMFWNNIESVLGELSL